MGGKASNAHNQWRTRFQNQRRIHEKLLKINMKLGHGRVFTRMAEREGAHDTSVAKDVVQPELSESSCVSPSSQSLWKTVRQSLLSLKTCITMKQPFQVYVHTPCKHINELWCGLTMIYYPEMKRNTALVTATWRNFVNISLRERSHTQRSMYHRIPFLWSSKWATIIDHIRSQDSTYPSEVVRTEYWKLPSSWRGTDYVAMCAL